MILDLFSTGRLLGLFFVTAIAELLGCYLPLLWLTGRVYASYGAVYIATALAWLAVVDGVKPLWTDYLGVGLALLGAACIGLGHRPA
nr:hypothetical protein [Massilia niastensis]